MNFKVVIGITFSGSVSCFLVANGRVNKLDCLYLVKWFKQGEPSFVPVQLYVIAS